ncbi:hypothetical protein CcaverHIS002_0209490 [Cutaneotrichosporon cavernicola]|uniref:HpcH/HpaI aldolase/citrate lyase domain-containing protein n=1 Tax=Cutaneotrichosporon cavernicola TaxID=279322 RepID=A0AA48I1Q2_9TREE|nr:uncharacterized protein CcaverHIS019_0209510 [Cutaneotrichosporon cavernicola]BEI81789.1 hypothetical protein CcaverHIS002_0209490 [Cutaneotrichosporon cavernicola]BEI89589.1 hypothetical protein CcaverHIS019_0209510 [Cutaneotrichosporon cavernicola]BEI97361.1 hypothetical protein CcaverHIS631_0209500 [Cutaneotrichosporon cavernicola]BEJ05137.1 hypothetical protein CcaverHIS641_0209540 [Cutaneotrichosporon cavernicola]
MDKRTYLKNALKQNEPGIGMWLTMGGSALAKTCATIPGFNWMLIDAEHGQITDKDYFDLCNHITAEQISPIIRIPSDESWMIKRALDSGAHGIMTPMCHDAATAKRIVDTSKFAPVGTRGCGSPFTHQVFGVKEGEYETTCDDNLLVIIQIESADGVKNVAEIAAVPGVDVLFCGPFDLAKSMDVPFGGKEHEAAIAKIVEETHKAGKKAAIFCTSGAQAKQRLQEGYDVVSICEDTASIVTEVSRQLEALKK